MMGQEAGGGAGDPAMTLAVPVGQYRDDYQFHAPQNYETNYVNVVAPLGATIRLDSVVLTGFLTIGSSGFGLVRHELAKNGSGNYRISGDDKFGITVYGYGVYTSFWYPGGLDLTTIVLQ